MVDYLLENHEEKVDRFLEFLPGFITWLVLLSPVWLGILAPQAVIFLLTFLSIYWVYSALIHTYGAIKGYRIYKKEVKADWLKMCGELNFDKLPEKSTLPRAKAGPPKNFYSLKHLILIPTVNEDYDVLKPTFDALANQEYPMENVFIAVTIEERGAKEVLKSLEKIKKNYKQKLPNILSFVHPAGIPREIVGGGAPNRTWGAKGAIKKLKEEGFNLNDFVFTTFDSDTILHPKFVARLAFAYLTTDKRLNKFFSSAYFLFDNNIWRVPPLMRIEANAVTLGTLSTWTVSKDTKETFSCYSIALPTLIDANFWDVTKIDDTVFYWRAFFARDGDFTSEIFYIPVSLDAVEGKTVWESHKSLYKQLVRWGWGSVTTPMALKGFLKNKKIPSDLKISWIINKIERHAIWRTIVFLITFGFIIVSLVNVNVRQSAAVYRLPEVISTLLTLALIFLLPTTILRKKLVTPIPSDWPIWKKALTYLEGPAVIINLLTFSFIPFIEAETKMMLGKKYKNAYFTPKIR